MQQLSVRHSPEDRGCTVFPRRREVEKTPLDALRSIDIGQTLCRGVLESVPNRESKKTKLFTRRRGVAESRSRGATKTESQRGTVRDEVARRRRATKPH